MTEPETPPALVVHAGVAAVGSGATGETGPDDNEEQADGMDV